MILDAFNNIKKYAALGAGFSDAVRFIAENKLSGLPAGRTDVSENCFVLNQIYETKPISEGKFESHHRYADLQYLVDGEETVVWQTVEKLTKIDEDPEKDFVLYQGDGVPLPLTAGNFMILFPKDAHMPSRTLHTPRTNRKLVFKIVCPENLK